MDRTIEERIEELEARLTGVSIALADVVVALDVDLPMFRPTLMLALDQSKAHARKLNRPSGAISEIAKLQKFVDGLGASLTASRNKPRPPPQPRRR